MKHLKLKIIREKFSSLEIIFIQKNKYRFDGVYQSTVNNNNKMSKVLCLHGLNNKYCKRLVHYSSIMCSYVWPSRNDALPFSVQVMYPEKNYHDEREEWVFLSYRKPAIFFVFPVNLLKLGILDTITTCVLKQIYIYINI